MSKLSHQKPFQTLWIDDLLIEEGPPFVAQVGWTPVAEGQNVIPNGSFEVDADRHYVSWGKRRNDRGPDTWEYSSEAAYEAQVPQPEQLLDHNRTDVPGTTSNAHPHFFAFRVLWRNFLRKAPV